MLVKTYGSALIGIHAATVTVEVSVAAGINFFMVGLPDSAVRESHHRIEAALKHNGYRIPGKRIVINMAPANIRKEGSAYDLTIAVGILAATGQMDASRVAQFMIMGELSLDGSVQAIRGALPIAMNARNKGLEGIILPEVNSREAAAVEGLKVYGVRHISQVIGFFDGQASLDPVHVDISADFFSQDHDDQTDFSEVKGQEHVKRAFEVAAGGGHNLLMIGPPGSGKTMLASRFPGILPPLSIEEALETTKIHSVAGTLKDNTSLMTLRPFRNPHHTLSDIAMTGGGSHPRPGEISLAHHGVLFLDELPEFRRQVLEVLRQPLENRVITISRARYSVDYPAGFMLVASMNPCPCGYYSHPEKDCVCAPGQVQKYLNRISGPLLDRIDLHLELTPLDLNDINSDRKPESSRVIRERVINARKLQEGRFRHDRGVYSNAQMQPRQIQVHCHINKPGRLLLQTAMEKLQLSARAYNRILKVSRTIADLGKSPDIKVEHLAEAIHYRSLDRENWGQIV